MTAMQARLNIDNTGFVISEEPALREDDAVLLTDAGRAIPLAQFTLMGQISATGKWIPLIDTTVVNGAAENLGIFMGDDIAAADLVAGDVVDAPVVYDGMHFDESKLVFDQGTLDMDDVIDVGTVNVRTIRQALHKQDLIPQLTRTATNFENA